MARTIKRAYARHTELFKVESVRLLTFYCFTTYMDRSPLDCLGSTQGKIPYKAGDIFCSMSADGETYEQTTRIPGRLAHSRFAI